jgi:hypothetical protein
MKAAGAWCLILLGAGLALAFQGPFGRGPGPGPEGLQTDQLKTYLGLTDQQVTDLTAVQKTLLDTATPLMRQGAAGYR